MPEQEQQRAGTEPDQLGEAVGGEDPQRASLVREGEDRRGDRSPGDGPTGPARQASDEGDEADDDGADRDRDSPAGWREDERSGGDAQAEREPEGAADQAAGEEQQSLEQVSTPNE